MHLLPVTSNVHLIHSLCHTLSEMFEVGELQTIVPIEHLVNVKVTDKMILDFITGILNPVSFHLYPQR